MAVDGDDVLPDMYIGRIPVSSTTTAANTANKIVGYEKTTAYAPTNALFSADNDDSFFETTCENYDRPPPLDNDRPEGLPQFLHFDGRSPPGDLVDAIDAGAMVTTYVGHGNVTLWASETLFDTDNVCGSGQRKQTHVRGGLRLPQRLVCRSGRILVDARLL